MFGRALFARMKYFATDLAVNVPSTREKALSAGKSCGFAPRRSSGCGLRAQAREEILVFRQAPHEDYR
jgi:hypothetical protein